MKPDLTAARAAWIELGKALESAEFAPPEARIWQERAVAALNFCVDALGIAAKTGMAYERKPMNESPLAMMVRELLTEWDRGKLALDEFETKMREMICHFARVYLPVDADLEKLKLVAKLAYQWKLRYQGFILGGTKIQPFWDAIDDLPSHLTNEAHREMADEIATWKADRPR